MNERNLGGIGLIQGRIVNNQEPARAVNQRLSLSPQRCSVGFKPMEQASERIVSGSLRFLGLNLRGLGRRNDTRRGEQEVDIVEVVDLRFIHTLILPQVKPTA